MKASGLFPHMLTIKRCSSRNFTFSNEFAAYGRNEKRPSALYEQLMITIGSISRETAAKRFPFLTQKYSGKRGAIKEFTHRDPDFVFWIYPDGRLHNARDSHAKNVPRGYEYIVDDEPDYGGFLRGRVASLFEEQLVVVYCREEALAAPGGKLTQLVRGLVLLPIAIREDALVISDNGDVYGTIADVQYREQVAVSEGGE